METLMRPWPWYVAGPLIGLLVPMLLVLGNKHFGVSGSLRAVCALVPSKVEFFKLDWTRAGAWSLAFSIGIILGGTLATQWLGSQTPEIAARTADALSSLGLSPANGLLPTEVFSWRALLTLRGFVCMVIGGFLIGFGTAYAGGCTSGHGIAGLAAFQLPSLFAVIAFFAGGVFGTFVVLPLLF
jgi:uncharacterized protein